MTNLHMTDHNILEKKNRAKVQNRAQSPQNINNKFSHFSSSWVLAI